MSAPILWIVLPGMASVILWFFRKHERNVLISALCITFFFMIASWFIEVGKPIIQIGDFTLQVDSSISILGRSFTLNNGDLVFVAFLFLILFIFLSMSFVIDVPSIFAPVSLLLITLVIAALSVQPFLFAALIVEICVLFSVTILSKRGEVPGIGVTRFLIFQTLAMPFMLASGWVLSAVEANPTDTNLIFQALILLGLGFSFWLGVFPFNTWMAQLAEEKSTFIVSFVLLLFNTAIIILIIRYLDGFVWLRDDAKIFSVLRVLGIVMVLSSGISFLLEKKWERTIAYVISYEAGLTLIAMSLNHVSGWNALLLMFLPRIMAVSVWAASVSYIKQSNDHPERGESLNSIVLIGLGCGLFTISGLPIFPGFTSRLLITTQLAVMDIQSMIWVASAMVLFVAGSIRFLFFIGSSNKFTKSGSIPKTEFSYFLVLCSFLFLVGIDPFSIGSKILSVLDAFPNIK